MLSNDLERCNGVEDSGRSGCSSISAANSVVLFCHIASALTGVEAGLAVGFFAAPLAIWVMVLFTENSFYKRGKSG